MEEEFKKELEQINNKLNDISIKAEENSKGIKKNADSLDEHVQKIDKNSYALEFIKDYKNGEERLYKLLKSLIKVLVFITILWACTIGYLVYVLNDVGTETKEIDIDNVDVIDQSNIENR